MRYKSKHKKLKPHYPISVFRVAALLACFVLITTYLHSGAYSKFFSGASGGDSARVARFSPDFTSTVITVENQLPGFPNDTDNSNSYVIDFSVQNTSDDKVSEVAMKYKIVLKTTGNLPLKFTLLDNSGNTTFETWDWNGISGKRSYEYKCVVLFYIISFLKKSKVNYHRFFTHNIASYICLIFSVF